MLRGGPSSSHGLDRFARLPVPAISQRVAGYETPFAMVAIAGHSSEFPAYPRPMAAALAAKPLGRILTASGSAATWICSRRGVPISGQAVESLDCGTWCSRRGAPDGIRTRAVGLKVRCKAAGQSMKPQVRR